MSNECCKKSFFQSAADTATRLAKDPRRAPTPIQEYRLKVCGSCEHFTDSGRCDLCGCYMDLKVRHRNLKCPIDKWKEWIDENEIPG